MQIVNGVHLNAQRSVLAIPRVPARTSGRLSTGTGNPCIRRAHAGNRSTAACIVSACSGAASLFGPCWLRTRRATSRVRSSHTQVRTHRLDQILRLGPGAWDRIGAECQRNTSHFYEITVLIGR